jgi:hypothetical protein
VRQFQCNATRHQTVRAFGEPDCTHPPAAERLEQEVRSDTSAGHEGRVSRWGLVADTRENGQPCQKFGSLDRSTARQQPKEHRYEPRIVPGQCLNPKVTPVRGHVERGIE